MEKAERGSKGKENDVTGKRIKNLYGSWEDRIREI